MTSRGRVDRSEWRWVAAWIAVALIVTSLPYAVGLARSTPDRVFSGATIAVEDVNSYIAKMRQGASGEWLFHLPYTAEPHAGALLYLFHLILGKLAAWIGLPLEWAYHAARVIFGALLLITLYRFIATFTGSTAIRRIAFWLATFAGGLGWVLMLSGRPNWLGSPPLDLILPEGFTFLVLYAMPHLALARTFLLLGLIVLWRERDGGTVGWLAGACWMAMALIVPFYVLVVYAIMFSALAASLRRLHRALVSRTLIACLIAASVPVYTWIVIVTSPVFATWNSQLQIRSPHPLHYVAAYVLIGGLALLSMRWAWRRGESWRRLVGWAVIVPPLLYAPFGAQRRLIESWQIPLSILAAVTLVRIVLPAARRSRMVRWLTRFPRYTSGGLQRWALSGLLLLATPTFGLLLLDQSLRAVVRESPMFRDGGEIAALDWLSARATYADVVLSAYATGNYLPTRVSARVFIGHGPETVHLEAKRPLVAKFYAAETGDDWREAFLREWGITYVFVGPFERELGTAHLSGQNYLRLEYDSEGYQVYRVSSDQ